MKLTEITDDDAFKKMMGGITGNTRPSVNPINRPKMPTRALTDRIFRALMDFDDPATTAKFRQFMQQLQLPMDDPPEV